MQLKFLFSSMFLNMLDSKPNEPSKKVIIQWVLLQPAITILLQIYPEDEIHFNEMKFSTIWRAVLMTQDQCFMTDMTWLT